MRLNNMLFVSIISVKQLVFLFFIKTEKDQHWLMHTHTHTYTLYFVYSSKYYIYYI